MATESVDTTEEMQEMQGGEMTPETSTGLDENVAGALSYVLGFITGLVFFLVEKDNEFVRFHAAQSMVLSIGVFLLSIVLSVVGALLPVLFLGDAFLSGGLLAGIFSLVFGLLSLVITVGIFLLWVYLIVSAYQGKSTRIPVVAGIADRIAA